MNLNLCHCHWYWKVRGDVGWRLMIRIVIEMSDRVVVWRWMREIWTTTTKMVRAITMMMKSRSRRDEQKGGNLDVLIKTGQFIPWRDVGEKLKLDGEGPCGGFIFRRPCDAGSFRRVDYRSLGRLTQEELVYGCVSLFRTWPTPIFSDLLHDGVERERGIHGMSFDGLKGIHSISCLYR